MRLRSLKARGVGCMRAKRVRNRYLSQRRAGERAIEIGAWNCIRVKLHAGRGRITCERGPDLVRWRWKRLG
jgi:hypothetical protein